MAAITTTAAETAVLLSLMRWAKTDGHPYNPLVSTADYTTLAAKLETARLADGLALAKSHTGETKGQ